MASYSNPGNRLVSIADMRPMLRGFQCEVIVIEIPQEPLVTRDGQKIYTFLVADHTGSIVMSLWGDIGKYFKVGDIVYITGGEAKLFKGSLQLTTLKYGKAQRVGEHTKPFVERPNVSRYQWVNDPDKPGPLRPVIPPS
ncbi:hypothetical protein IWQ62_004765 [Dispira parvispora]|uniref:OB domain-containing protein n=1 Tax=Dispira parvispora TaxID=1520584 RepID=A0A9W8E5V0_9FUNG|nr:hypothetical protein IWQ62_004765 [Dispira parvispora]